jgi:membrane protein YdbS with pleckstrin-like domain
MSYADSLLASGEQIVRREHQHWFVFVWAAKYAVLAVIIGIVALLLSTRLDTGGTVGTLRNVIGLVVLLAVVAGLVQFTWTALRYRNEEYVITSRRVMHTEGVLNKKSTDSSLEKINDAVLTQSLFGRIFGFGDLEVLTASEEGIERLRMLIDAIGFKKSMLDAKHELELELTRPVMPPLRSTTTTTASADAPTGPVSIAAAEPPPAAMSADDVTKALAGLADLRDRGAVTPEEYEAKKSELLARL